MSPQFDFKSHNLIAIAPSDWTTLLNLYTEKRTEPTGYSLISNYIRWIAKEPDLDIQCLSLDGDWRKDGTFLMIVQKNTFLSINNGTQRKTVFFNTLSDNLERLINALLCLTTRAGNYALHDYGERLVPAVDVCIKQCNRPSQTTQTALYRVSKEIVATFSTAPPAGFTLRSLSADDAATVNENWPYGTKDSVKFVTRLINYNVSVGAFAADGQLIAWCLRIPIGALGLLQVLESHRRLGLGALVVRYLSKKIYELGDEVLAPVVTENTASRKLFEKLGFHKIDNVYWTNV